MWQVRKTAFEAVGGIDENMSAEGMCGVHSDYDLVLRMWLAGWQVMQVLCRCRTTLYSAVPRDEGGRP